MVTLRACPTNRKGVAAPRTPLGCRPVKNCRKLISTTVSTECISGVRDGNIHQHRHSTKSRRPWECSSPSPRRARRRSIPKLDRDSTEYRHRSRHLDSFATHRGHEAMAVVLVSSPDWIFSGTMSNFSKSWRVRESDVCHAACSSSSLSCWKVDTKPDAKT